MTLGNIFGSDSFNVIMAIMHLFNLFTGQSQVGDSQDADINWHKMTFKVTIARSK